MAGHFIELALEHRDVCIMVMHLVRGVRRHLADPRSDHRRIASGFLWVSLFVFVGKVAGAAKEMVIAWRYGVSETVDAYVFVFNLVNSPVALWFGVLGVVLIPLVARTRLEDSAALNSFSGELLGLTLLMGCVAGCIGYFGIHVLLSTGSVGFSPAAMRQALDMAAPMSLLIPLGMVISVLSAWMMGHGRHSNSVLEGVPALAVMLALLLPIGLQHQPLVWGTVVGFALQLFCLGLLLRGMGDLQAPRFRIRSPAWKGFWGGFGIMVAGQAFMSVTGVVDQFFAAELGVGAISTLSYANRIMALILGLGATAISRSTLPIFSDVVAVGKTGELRHLAQRWATWMFVGGLVAAVAGWLLSRTFVEVLFERGAFTAQDTSNVTEVLQYALTQLPFYFGGIVLVSLLASRGEYRTIAWVAGANLAVKLVGMFALVPFLGIKAIPLSATLMYATTLMFFAYSVKTIGKH